MSSNSSTRRLIQRALASHLGNKSPAIITCGRLPGEAVGIIYNPPRTQMMTVNNCARQHCWRRTTRGRRRRRRRRGKGFFYYSNTSYPCQEREQAVADPSDRWASCRSSPDRLIALMNDGAWTRMLDYGGR